MTTDDFFRAINEYRQFVLADKKFFKLYEEM